MKRDFEILDHHRWDTRPGIVVLYRGERCGMINERQIKASGEVIVEVVFDNTPGGRDIYERTEEDRVS